MTRQLAGAVAGLLLILAGTPVPAGADQLDPRLDGLLERLRHTADTAEAGRLERQVWQIWGEADDPAARRLMAQGLHAMALGGLAQALGRFDRLVDVAPDFAEGWNKRATVHYLMGNYGASVRDIQRTLALEPRHFGALSGLGLIYEAVGEPAAALRSLEAALSINPHLEGARQRLEELRREIEGSRI